MNGLTNTILQMMDTTPDKVDYMGYLLWEMPQA